MSFYMLSADTVVALLRNPRGAIYKRLRQIDEDQIAISIVAAAEIRRRAASCEEETRTAIDRFLAAVQILPLEDGVDRSFAELSGASLDDIDRLNAAHALDAGATLVTTNRNAYRRFPALTTENWLR